MEIQKEDVLEYASTPVEDRLSLLVSRGLLTSKELVQARESRFVDDVCHKAYQVFRKSESDQTTVQSYATALDDVIKAERDGKFDESFDVLNENPVLREAYWRTEQGTSAAMHNQILRLGREMIRRKYGL